LTPSSGYQGFAEFAAAVLYSKLTQEIAFPLNKNLPAVMTVGIASFMSGYIPQVYITNTFLPGQIPELLHCLYGRGGQSRQLVLRKEPEEMKRIVGSEFLENPSTHSLDHFRVIHIGGDHEGGHFKPDTLSVECFKGVENWLKTTTVQALIYTIIKGFKVDVGPIKVKSKFEERSSVYVAIGDQNVFETLLPGISGRVIGVFVVGNSF
jgi:hypothetical protein